MSAVDQTPSHAGAESIIETGSEDLLGHRVGHVAVLTFNRPERRNALSNAMYEGFNLDPPLC